MSDNVRNPRQQRAIDKKNRIILAGYELFAEKGYFNTNTAEIAKQAGVSTGIVYGYFHDKKDILIEVVDIYTEHNSKIVFELFDNLVSPIDFDKLLEQIVETVIQIHKQNSSIHEALYSLSAYDQTVNAKFMQFEASITDAICSRLIDLGYAPDDLTERVHLSMELIQSYAHECVFDQHKYINYAAMKKLILSLLVQIFNK